jgi:hypothetical protein
MKIITITSHDLDSMAISSPNILIIMPFINYSKAQETAAILSKRANLEGTIICIDDEKREGIVFIANQIFKQSSSVFVGYVAEDAFPGMNWLNMGFKKLQSSAASLLAFNDGKWQGNLASFGLVKREWAQKNYQGNLFYPFYHSHYADTELTLLAKSDKVFTYEPHSILLEVDFEKEEKKVNHNDRLLFSKRTKTGFDGRIKDLNLLQMFS